jgi:DNA-binding transcriptional LysR family regulator
VQVFVTEDSPRFLEHPLVNGELDVAIRVSNALSEPQALVAVRSLVAAGAGTAVLPDSPYRPWTLDAGHVGGEPSARRGTHCGYRAGGAARG